MILKNIPTGMGALIVGFILQAGLVMAAEQQKVENYLPRYNVLKTNTSALLYSLRQDRLEGRSLKDRRPLLQLRKEVMDLCYEARREGHLQKVSNSSTPRYEADRLHLLALAYACEAMEQVLEAEWDTLQNGHGDSTVLQEIREKYEEVWKVADHLVTGAR